VAQRQSGEHDVERFVRKRQLFGAGMGKQQGQPCGGDPAGGSQHLLRQVNTDQVRRWVVRSGAAQQLPGATADIKDRLRLRSVLERELQGGLADGTEQELLQNTVLVGACPPINRLMVAVNVLSEDWLVSDVPRCAGSPPGDP
jgi:hypothetical protein